VYTSFIHFSWNFYTPSSFLFYQTVHHNAYYEDPYAQEFGIKIDERLASVEARVLPPPRVCLFICNYTTANFQYGHMLCIATDCIFFWH
jgi:hypothetical protein